MVFCCLKMPRIVVEDKHTYSHMDVNILGNIRTTSVIAPFGTFRWHAPAYPVQGTDEDQRIGKKIQTSSILVEGYLSIDNIPISSVPSTGYPSLLYYLNGYIQQSLTVLPADNFEWDMVFNNLKVPIRHMVVEFWDQDFYRGTAAEQGVYLSDWYKNLVIQSSALSTDYPSVRQEVLRESTKYTGHFKILRDTTYWLDMKNKKTIHFNYSLPYQRNVSFDAAGSDPANSHVYLLFIGPTNPWFDYNDHGFAHFLLGGLNTNIDVPPVVADLDLTCKLK